MEKRYIDALTEICGATSVLYEMSDIERYLYDETEEYVGVENEFVLETVFALFKERNKDFFTFE